MGPDDRAALAKRLLSAGASLQAVLVQCGIRQADVMRAAGLHREPRRYQPRVSHILARPTAPGSEQGARREGTALRLRVYRAAAKLLGVDLPDIPEARDVIERPRR